MQIAQARPPFVEFKRIAVRDVKRSEEAGRHVTKDVDMAFIMQPGSKDVVERIATDWLDMLKVKVMNNAPDAYPEEWVNAFHNKYKAWQEGLDAPLNGTSVREWPVLSPAQAENFIALRILTIEDVAAMTEDAMRHFGMGGRELKDKAIRWVQGQDAAAHALQENASLKEQLAALQAQMDELKAAAEPKRRKKTEQDAPATVE
jgi:hypothetical protein